ncbi:MAG: type IV pilus modification PilV family protein [Candidatus Hydrogenedentales bacterium]
MKRQNGYSLLEVLIALSIMMIGIGGVYRLFPMSMQAARLADEKIVSSELASSRLGRLRSSGVQGVMLNFRTSPDAWDVDEHYTKVLSAADQAHASYEGYTTILQRLQGARDVYYQRALFTVRMSDGRDETFVTYIVEQ